MLVIDDEPAVREMFKAALESWGYIADTAPTGVAGLELFKRGGYAVVLSDYLMPGMTGFQMAVEMRQHTRNVQVILITGSVLADPQLDAARRSGFTVLRKPIQLADLKTTIDETVRTATRSRS